MVDIQSACFLHCLAVCMHHTNHNFKHLCFKTNEVTAEKPNYFKCHSQIFSWFILRHLQAEIRGGHSVQENQVKNNIAICKNALQQGSRRNLLHI